MLISSVTFAIGVLINKTTLKGKCLLEIWGKITGRRGVVWVGGMGH